MVAQHSQAQVSDKIQFQQEQDEWDKKWEKKIVTYSLIRDSKDISDDSAENVAVYLAMMAWGLEIDLDLIVVRKESNPDIKIEFTDSNSEIVFKNNPNVLAYATFPGTPTQGTIKFNDDKLWSLDGKPIDSEKTYNMLHTLIHEIGHSLGLTHSVGIHSEDSVLYSAYNNKLVLSPYDVLRIARKYGNKGWEDYGLYQECKDSIGNLIKNM